MTANSRQGPGPTESADGPAALPDVCVVTHPLAAAGENATRSLLDILASITGVVLVTANLPGDSTIRDDREVIEITKEATGDSVVVAAVRFALNQLRMCRVIWRRDEEVVLFFGATSYLLPIAFARIVGKRVLVEPRGDVPLTLRLNWEQRMPVLVACLLASVVRILERMGFIAAHRVVTYTPAMARELGIDPNSPNVFPEGARYVDIDRFDVRTPYERRNCIVGFLGRLDEEKGVRKLAAVARELPQDVYFRFVGDGDLREWLETELVDEIESGHVEVTGWVDHDEVPTQLNEFQLLVLPSQPTEGLPTTILEAMACGTPVLATPVSGVPDLIQDGETGYHLESADATMIVQRIESILRAERGEAVSEAARSKIEREYSFRAATDRYCKLLARDDD